MNCIKCNTTLPPNALFCHICGKKQGSSTSRGIKRRGNGQGTVYKRGKSWTAEVVIGRNPTTLMPVRRTKGGFATKKQALEYIPILRSNDRLSEKTANITFSALYEKWKPSYEDRVSETTMRGHTSAYEWFKSIWYIPFADICTEDLQNCVDACSRGKRTKENMKSLAMALYKYAGANRITTHNYAQYIYCGNEAKGTRPPFTNEEIEKIRSAIGKLPYADYVYCMIYTGFRPNEMLSLTIDAYDSRTNTLTGGFKTEAGRNRCVTISPKIQPIIARLCTPDKVYIFAKEDGTLMDDAYFRRYCFNPLMERLGISGKVPYSCRHTFANLMKNVRGSDTDKAALIGHADASMTKYYQSPDYESLKAITDSI